MSKKLRALDLILQRGLIADEKEARACLMAGQVYSGSRRIAGASEMLPIDCELHVRGLDMPFVSKGGLKLSGAIRDFDIDVTGRVCIDAGASTGGFTDCLVHAGCARVYAVDVGFGQLHGSLRQHPAVVNLEKTNISDDVLFTLDPKPDLGTVDLSYLSLRKAIPAFSAVLKGEGELLCLVKPLFEIDDAQTRREGVIAPEQYAPLLRALCADIERERMGAITGLTHSRITGNGGTIEFFIRLRLDGEEGQLSPEALESAIEQSVSEGLKLEKFKKA